MTPKSFAYWLQGFAELHQEPPTPEQWQSIRDHLSLVFQKVTSPGPVVVPTPFTPIGPAVIPSRSTDPYAPYTGPMCSKAD